MSTESRDGQHETGWAGLPTDEVDRREAVARAEEANAKRAVALRYNVENDAAPHLTARGSGTAADRMIALARKEGIPVREDAGLLTLLAASEIGEEIPVELFEVVASLLTYLYQLNGELCSTD